jgi:hypothetical protein
MSFVKSLQRAYFGLQTARHLASTADGIVPLMQAIESYKNHLRGIGVKQTDLEIEKLEEFQTYYSGYLDRIDFHLDGRFDVYKAEILRRMDVIFEDIFKVKENSTRLNREVEENDPLLPKVGGRFVNIEVSGTASYVQTLSDRFSEAIPIIRSDNELGEERRIFDEIKRAQLIAMMEAMLRELKGPYLDKAKVDETETWLSNLSRRLRDEGTARLVVLGLDGCVEALKHVGSAIKNSVGADFPF